MGKIYIKEVKGLKIEVPHGSCGYVNYNPQEIKTCGNGLVTLVANGVARKFKLVDKINISDWEIINPSFMIYKGGK